MIDIIVEPLSQQDQRWSQIHLGTSTQTIGGAGCAITCLAMLANCLGLRQPPTDPSLINQIFIYEGGYRLTNLVNWVKVGTFFLGLTYRSRTDCPTTPAPMTEIDAALRRMPLIVYVNSRWKERGQFMQHFVLLTKKEGPNNYVIADPLIGDIRALCPTYGDTPAFAICGVIWLDYGPCRVPDIPGQGMQQ